MKCPGYSKKIAWLPRCKFPKANLFHAKSLSSLSYTYPSLSFWVLLLRSWPSRSARSRDEAPLLMGHKIKPLMQLWPFSLIGLLSPLAWSHSCVGAHRGPAVFLQGFVILSSKSCQALYLSPAPLPSFDYTNFPSKLCVFSFSKLHANCTGVTHCQLPDATTPAFLHLCIVQSLKFL